MGDSHSKIGSEKSDTGTATAAKTATPTGATTASASPQRDQQHQPTVSNAPRQFEEAYANYMKSLYQIATSMHQHVEKTSLDYRRATLESWLQLNTPEALQDAFQAWQKSSVNSWSSADGQKRSEEAYRTFLRAIQKAWAEADLETIDPVLLTGIANSMVAVAHYAHAHLGRQTPAT